jgi:Type II site-specific deoxyribonuclease
MAQPRHSGCHVQSVPTLATAPQPQDAPVSADLTDAQIAARITAGLSSLDRPQLALLYRFMAAMQRPVGITARPDSDVATPLFVSAVGHYLSLHHATTTTPLNKKGFEFLFQFASDASGRHARINRNTTDANADVVVEGVGFSLKTQADKAVKKHTMYIQKLMEARWIREINTPQEFHDIGVRHILSHLERYQRILVLKAYPRTGETVKYELVEVPKAVFGLLSGLGVSDFPVKNSFGTCSVPVRDAAGEAFRLVFDGSVEKIRIFNLRARNCISHAEWAVNVPEDDEG